MDKFSIVRTMHTKGNDHPQATHCVVSHTDVIHTAGQPPTLPFCVGWTRSGFTPALREQLFKQFRGWSPTLDRVYFFSGLEKYSRILAFQGVSSGPHFVLSLNSSLVRVIW